MNVKLHPVPQIDRIETDAVAGLIARTQRADGDIPWSENDKTDPWDLMESAMGLNIGGYRAEARKAFEWMMRRQLDDGSWHASYRNGLPEDKTRDANMSSYIAVAVLHDYLITGDRAFLEHIWPTVHLGIVFALNLQAEGGQIHWAVSPEGIVDPMALLTGSCSVYMSLKCALRIADILGFDMPEWRSSLTRLGNAIRNKPHLFNMTKSRFSMDWFYPILCGAIRGEDARRRIEKFWKKFVVEEKGVRCVSDEPWITVAETSELVLTLHAMGDSRLAEIVFNWILDKRFEDGSCWCGFTVPDHIVWPVEKVTWTNAVLLMAADALYTLTPASRIFEHEFWKDSSVAPCL